MSFISATIFGLVAKEPEICLTNDGRSFLKVFIGVPPLKAKKGNTQCFIECTAWNYVVVQRMREIGLQKGDYAVAYGELVMDLYQGSWFPKLNIADIQKAHAYKPRENAPETYLTRNTPNSVVLNKKEEQEEQNIDFDW